MPCNSFICMKLSSVQAIQNAELMCRWGAWLWKHYPSSPLQHWDILSKRSKCFHLFLVSHNLRPTSKSPLFFSGQWTEASSNYIVEIEKAQSTNFCNKGEFSQLMVIYLTNNIFLFQNSLNLCCFSEVILFSSHIYDDQVWREKSQLKSHIVFLTKLERFLYRQKLYTISPPNIWG